MAIVFRDAQMLVDKAVLTSDLSSLQVNYGSEILDATTFGLTTRSKVGGLKTVGIEGEGYVNLDSSSSDAVIFGRVASPDTVVSVWSTGITVGTSFGGLGLSGAIASYDVGGNVGALLPFKLKVESQSDLVHAAALENMLTCAWSTVAGSGTGVAVPLTHCSTGEKLYAGLHITTLSTGLGTTISAVVQAASSSGFATSNNRITFSAVSCKTAVFATPIAASALSSEQPFYRIVVTVSTGTGTFSCANGIAWAGIQ